MVFDETSLHEAIIKTWGEHGAHNDVFTAMRHHLRSVEAENERLRVALRAAGLAPNVVDAIAEGEPPRPCPAGHGDQCCGYPAACEASLTGISKEDNHD